MKVLSLSPGAEGSRVYENATEAERQMMDAWFDQMGYTMERVLEACNKTAGISSPNFNYVNKVLENWSSEAQRRVKM